MSTRPTGFVLVAWDQRMPQFFTDKKGVVSAQPRFMDATVFPDGDAARKVLVDFQGDAKAPPFEVMPVTEAAMLQNKC